MYTYAMQSSLAIGQILNLFICSIWSVCKHMYLGALEHLFGLFLYVMFEWYLIYGACCQRGCFLELMLRETEVGGSLMKSKIKELLGVAEILGLIQLSLNWFRYFLSALCIGCVFWISYISSLELRIEGYMYGVVNMRYRIIIYNPPSRFRTRYTLAWKKGVVSLYIWV